MKISARNCLEGKVVSIKKGPVSTEVTLETASGEKIVSSITTASAESPRARCRRQGFRRDQGVQRHGGCGVSSIPPPPPERRQNRGRFSFAEPAFL